MYNLGFLLGNNCFFYFFYLKLSKNISNRKAKFIQWITGGLSVFDIGQLHVYLQHKSTRTLLLQYIWTVRRPVVF